MAYASCADVEERLGTAVYVQLTDDAGTGSADEEKVVEALAGSEGEVNSYLGRRYAVPVDPAGEAELAALLKSVALDLAVCRLHARRSPVPADVQRRREEAIQWLVRVAAGQAVLPAGAVLRDNAALGPRVGMSGDGRVMTREQLEDL